MMQIKVWIAAGVGFEPTKPTTLPKVFSFTTPKVAAITILPPRLYEKEPAPDGQQVDLLAVRYGFRRTIAPC